MLYFLINPATVGLEWIPTSLILIILVISVQTSAYFFSFCFSTTIYMSVYIKLTII
jgi:hypothetical protein